MSFLNGLIAVLMVFHFNIAIATEASSATLSAEQIRALKEKWGADPNSKGLDKRGEGKKDIRDFLQAAFPDHLWVTPYGSVFSFLFDDALDHELHDRFPLLFKEYVFRKNGLPKYGVINKWKERSVNVEFGWPLKGLEGWKRAVQEQDKYAERISPIISKSVQSIGDIGAVDLRYLEHKDKDYSPQPSIRIIPFTNVQSNQEPRFAKEYFHDGFQIWSLEPALKAAVRFSPSSPNQVEGYFLSDAHNNIEMGVCYINVNVNDSLLKSYIDECILRALGLPEISPADNGVLAVRHSNEAVSVSPEDIKLLKILYNPDVHAGDDKYAVIKTISKTITEEK